MIRDKLTPAQRKELKDELSRLWELQASATRDTGDGGMSNEEAPQRRHRIQQILTLLESQ